MYGKPRRLGKSINILVLLCSAAMCGFACSDGKTAPDHGGSRGPIDLALTLSWLPADTESLLVANGPIWMSNFQTADEGNKNIDVPSENLAKAFENLTLEQFNFKNDFLEKHLEGKKLLFAVEGSRHFRSPSGLGEMPYEGCEIGVFKDDLRDRRDAFMKEASPTEVRTETIEGQEVAEFEETHEQDIWTIYVAFPQDGVVLVATNKSYLQEVLARMQNAQGDRALPDNLPEWKYVNKRAQFWGLRHYAKQQSADDPTSPFGGQKSANMPDDDAVGLTYQCDPSAERSAILTYLSGPKTDVRAIEARRFPSLADPEGTAGLQIKYQVLEPGVIQTTYDLSHSQPLEWFVFVLMGSMGHAVYI